MQTVVVNPDRFLPAPDPTDRRLQRRLPPGPVERANIRRKRREAVKSSWQHASLDIDLLMKIERQICWTRMLIEMVSSS
jgi:hypothetical protein